MQIKGMIYHDFVPTKPEGFFFLRANNAPVPLYTPEPTNSSDSTKPF